MLGLQKVGWIIAHPAREKGYKSISDSQVVLYCMYVCMHTVICKCVFINV